MYIKVDESKIDLSELKIIHTGKLGRTDYFKLLNEGEKIIGFVSTSSSLGLAQH